MVKKIKDRFLGDVYSSLECDLNLLFANLFEKITETSFDCYSKIWKELDFSMIHAVYAPNMERFLFLKFIFDSLILRWTNSKTRKMKIFIIYTLFSIFISQPNDLSPIRIEISIPIFKDMQGFADSNEEGKETKMERERDHSSSSLSLLSLSSSGNDKINNADSENDKCQNDVFDIFYHLLDQEAFNFVARLENLEQKYNLMHSKQMISRELSNLFTELKNRDSILTDIQRELSETFTQYETSKADLSKKLQKTLFSNQENVNLFIKLKEFATMMDITGPDASLITTSTSPSKLEIKKSSLDRNDIKRSASAPPLFSATMLGDYCDMPDI